MCIDYSVFVSLSHIYTRREGVGDILKKEEQRYTKPIHLHLRMQTVYKKKKVMLRTEPRDKVSLV